MCAPNNWFGEMTVLVDLYTSHKHNGDFVLRQTRSLQLNYLKLMKLSFRSSPRTAVNSHTCAFAFEERSAGR